jgi:phosphoribosyl 1,2-cyclic phosphodiesterase
MKSAVCYNNLTFRGEFMEFHILASGSKGNSVFIFDHGEGILIDCGISRKQLLYRLEMVGFKETDIRHVLLTHDHYDHNKNISIFNRQIVYCGKNCIKDINDEQILWPYQKRSLGHFQVVPLQISHDATSPLAFSIAGEKETLLYMTDTGYVSQKNLSYMWNHDYYIMESNHDIEMLMSSSRPIFLKNRILGDQGHLNNRYSAEVMCKVLGDNTKEIVLAHLSEEANTPVQALSTYQQVFLEKGIAFSNIKVASQVDVVSGGKHREN